MKVIDMTAARIKRQRLDPDKIFSEFMVGVESKIKEKKKAVKKKQCMAEKLFDAWRDDPTSTTQDLADQCEAAGASRRDGDVCDGHDGDVWTFDDGSSVELVWGLPHKVVRSPEGDVL